LKPLAAMAQDDNYIENPIDGRPLSKPPTTIIGIVLTIIFIFLLAYSFRNDKQLKKNGITTTAKITNWRMDAKSGKHLDYEFTMDNKTYVGSKLYFGLDVYEAKSLVGKTFPVIFVSNDPDKNQLLIKSEEFIDYRVTRPDSLKQYDKLFTN
jgi:hypothetical protein